MRVNFLQCTPIMQVFTPGIHKKPYNKSSKIKQIQLEQDSGKSLHDSKSKESLIDLNRAGAPLIELVFEPDLEDGEEAAALVKELVLILQRIDACTCRMQEGALRVDANVSLNREGEPLSTRTEIKNIGSVRAVAGAIKHEIERQRSVLEKGGFISNETRAWDATNKTTVSMRDKEVVQDYRFMPEPNLPPLRVNLKTKEDDKDVVSVPLMRDQIPELPEQTRRKLINNLDLRPDLAIRLVNEPKLLKYFEEIVSKTDANATDIALILTYDILGVLNRRKVNIEDCPLSIEQVKEAINMVLLKEINIEIFKQVIDEYVVSPNEDISPRNLVEKKGWFLITDENVIIKECMEVLKSNPKLVKKYKNGKVKVFRTFLGMLAKNTQNTIDMSLASKKLDELLKSDKI